MLACTPARGLHALLARSLRSNRLGVSWISTSMKHRMYASPTIQSQVEQSRLPLDKRKYVPKQPARYIKNLNPRSIDPADYIDASGRLSMEVYFTPEAASGSSRRAISLLSKTISRPGTGRGRFSEGCRGFLYFYEDPNGHPLVSGIRIRIAQERSQIGFDKGHDYVSPSGEVWSYSLIALLGRGQRVTQRLLDDKLIDSASATKWSEIIPNSVLANDRGPLKNLLMSVDEPFEVELSSNGRRLHLLDQEDSQMYHFNFVPLQVPVRMGTTQRRPAYKGRILIRLLKVNEIPLSEIPHRIKYNIQVLKILTPVESIISDYDHGISIPGEGSLITRDGIPLTRSLKLYASRGRASYQPERHVIPGPLGRRISTLNPLKLSENDHLDYSQVSNRLYTSGNALIPRTAGGPEHGMRATNVINIRQTALSILLGRSGFLYYHQEFPSEPLSGQLRFRTTQQETLLAFDNAKDLILPGQYSPWRIPLIRLLLSDAFGPIVQQLIKDGLITDETVKLGRDLCHSSGFKPRPYSKLIYSLDEPFLIDLYQGRNATINVVDGNAHCIQMMYLQEILPRLVGTFLVQFQQTSERSYNDFPCKVGHLQVLQVLDSFRPRNPDEEVDPLEIPQEGSFLLDKTGQRLNAYFFDRRCGRYWRRPPDDRE